MTDFLSAAKALKDELVANRRTLHGYAELAFDLPQTTALVMAELTRYGYQPQRLGQAGVVATVGRPGPTILLRADMDALPMTETSGLDFAATGEHCHACGHDLHTAMLLGAAKLLKEHEAELRGTVKFMFQPAEEILGGANDMIAAGVLTDPPVDAALALHVRAGEAETATGRLFYKKGAFTKSGDAINITVVGKDAHGSTPELGVDAIAIAAAIIQALQQYQSREIPSDEDFVLLVGKITGGTACNTVAGEVVMECSLRTTKNELREKAIARITEIAQGLAATFDAEARVDHVYGSPVLENDPALIETLEPTLRELLGAYQLDCKGRVVGSEDFAAISALVPSAYLMLGAGSSDDGYLHGLHHPGVVFDEEVLPIGAGLYASCAAAYLESVAG